MRFGVRLAELSFSSTFLIYLFESKRIVVPGLIEGKNIFLLFDYDLYLFIDAAIGTFLTDIITKRFNSHLLNIT